MINNKENPLSDTCGGGLIGLFQCGNFGLDYAESLTEGDLRPIVIKNYTEEHEEGEK